MQFYLVFGHFNRGILARVMRRGGTHIKIVLLMCAMGAAFFSFFSVPALWSKRLRRCQTPAIVVVAVMLEVAVVFMSVVGLATLAYFTTLSLDLALALYLFPPPVGAQSGPTWTPPSRHWRDAGGRTAQDWQRIGGIDQICGNSLPLQKSLSFPMTSPAPLPPR